MFLGTCLQIVLLLSSLSIKLILFVLVGVARVDKILRDGGEHVNPEVIEKMIHHFASHVVLIETHNDLERAKEYYAKAEQIVASKTLAYACRGDPKLGQFVLNGIVHCEGNDLQIAFGKASCIPYVIKKVHSTENMRRLLVSVDSLGLDVEPSAAPHAHLTTCTNIPLRRHILSIMPYYTATLECFKLESPDAINKLCEQMLSVCDFIHVKGFAHMDIKPKNICINSNGDFVLVDLDSMAMFNELTRSTVAFLPLELGNDFDLQFGIQAASSIDYWMLGVSLLKKIQTFTDPQVRVSCGVVVDFIRASGNGLKPETITAMTALLKH